MRFWGGWGLVGAAMGWGCSGPALDVPDPIEASVSVDFEPAAGVDALTLGFRARLRAAPTSGTPWLFRGQLSEYYARSLERGDVPDALRERAVPLRFWREAADCWLQPLEWLEPDSNYTLAFTGLGAVRELQTQGPSQPRTRRLFPPPGARKHRAAVVCDMDDEVAPSPFLLEPGGVAVRASSGMAGKPARGCLTLQVEGELTDTAVAPPSFAGALLEPSPWLPPAVGEETTLVGTCRDGEVFHGACLQVLDDRLRVTPLAQDLFFALEQPQSLVLSASAGSRSLLLRGLTPGAEVTLGGSVLSSDGQHDTFRATLTMAPAGRHLVLNEVLANPLGPEPDAEWLELVNDSDASASLADVWLEDSGGAAQLPAVELSPGEIALVVGDGFRPSGLDVPLPDGVRLLRVASLGSRGLANGGEALLLVGREGVLSRFPLLASPHAGCSVARRTLDGADDDATGFAEHAGLGASPGAPNVLAD